MTLEKKEVLPGTDPWQEQPRPMQRRTAFTPVSWGLIGISVALFAVELFGVRLAELGVLWGPALAEGQWWRLVTWIVLHGNLLHLAFNLSVVWTLGRGLEHAMQPGRFALVSMVGALGSAAFVLLFDFARPTLGLSGVILAWAGVALPMLDRRGRREMWVWLAQVLVISLLPGVSWAAHLGGFLSGAVVGLALRYRAVRFSRALPIVAFVCGVLVLVALRRHQG